MNEDRLDPSDQKEWFGSIFVRVDQEPPVRVSLDAESDLDRNFSLERLEIRLEERVRVWRENDRTCLCAEDLGMI